MYFRHGALSLLAFFFGSACAIQAEGTLDLASWGEGGTTQGGAGSLGGGPSSGEGGGDSSEGGEQGDAGDGGSTIAGAGGDAGVGGDAGEGGNAGAGNAGGSNAGAGGEAGAGGSKAGSGGSTTAGAGGSKAGSGGSTTAGAGGDMGEGGEGGSPVSCSKGEDCGKNQPCLLFECNQGYCSKIFSEKGASCDTDSDKCNGSCFCDGNGEEVPVEPAIVDDNNDCTEDSCDQKTGKISHVPIDQCVGCSENQPCPVAPPCSSAECINSKCEIFFLSKGAICNDSNKCNGEEVCDGAGKCIPGIPVDMDDHNACTDDICDESNGEVAHFDKECNIKPSCDSSTGKAIQVECDKEKGCISTEIPCQNRLGCKGTVCATSCQPNEKEGCADGFICRPSGDGCALPVGAQCTKKNECATGYCELNEDGVKICAAVSCGGCEVVNKSGIKCVAVPSDQDPKNNCETKHAGCESKDNCDGQGACQKKKNGDSCNGLGKCKGNKCCGPAGVICD